MRTYYLKTRDGEIINRLVSSSKIEAVEFFSEIKKISIIDLQDIFIITTKKGI